MVWCRRSHVARGLTLIGSCQALAQQVPMGAGDGQMPLQTGHRPLVDTGALQGSIKTENLLARAKELYEIAKLGEDEYNHPTRVIGSEGKSVPGHATLLPLQHTY